MSGGLKRKLEQHLDELPVLPTAVAQLMTLRVEDESHADRVVHILESEPNFTARLIAAANSAGSAPVAPITTLRGAVARMGSRSASNLILACAVTRVFVPRDDWEKSLWRHAIQVAMAARNLATRTTGVDPDEAYTAGLLHDLGRFVMFQEAPDELRRLDEGDWTTGDELIASERAICGLTHTELGALACAKWKLPSLVCQVARHHHDGSAAIADVKVAKLVALIRFADIAMFPSAVPGSPGWQDAPEEEVERTLMPRLPAFLRLGTRELQAVLRATATAATELARELGVS